MRKNQYGFSFLEVLVIIIVLAVVGFVGYTVIDRSNNKGETSPTSQSSKQQSATADDVAEAPDVTSTSDLNKAESTLDGMDVDSQSDTAQLDAELAAF